MAGNEKHDIYAEPEAPPDSFEAALARELMESSFVEVMARLEHEFDEATVAYLTEKDTLQADEETASAV